jgi:hypothetical protein
MGEINVHDDYRTLLADGAVGHGSHEFPWRGRRSEWERGISRWANDLVKLAKADGLRAGHFWVTYSDIDADPCVELLRRDGAQMGAPNTFPWDQVSMAEWHRPQAVAEWGETLDAARRRAGIDVPHAEPSRVPSRRFRLFRQRGG